MKHTLWIAAAAISLLAAPACAQSILPFSTESVSIHRLPTSRCLYIQIMITARPSDDQRDLSATANFIYRQVAKLNTFGDIAINLKRDDIAKRPLTESRLAQLDASASAKDCGAVDRISRLQVASRLLTERELAIRDIRDRLSDLDPDTADAKVRKLFNLPKNWQLPSVTMIDAPPAEPAKDSAVFQPDTDSLIAKITARLATISAL